MVKILAISSFVSGLQFVKKNRAVSSFLYGLKLAERAKNREISSLLSGLELVKRNYFFSKQICYEETKVVSKSLRNI